MKGVLDMVGVFTISLDLTLIRVDHSQQLNIGGQDKRSIPLNSRYDNLVMSIMLQSPPGDLTEVISHETTFLLSSFPCPILLPLHVFRFLLRELV